MSPDSVPVTINGRETPLPLFSHPVDGFRLAYERSGDGPTVVALHGWPGDRHDWRDVAAALGGRVDFIAVDLRGFGDSDKRPVDPATAYTAKAQARSVLALIDELRLGPVVLAGVDLGSMVADELVRMRPQVFAGLVISPPVPGLAARLAEPGSIRERWYIAFHQTRLAATLIDGHRDSVAAYLAYFWMHWSGPDFQLDARELERLVEHYSTPGAFTASTAIYRSGRPQADPAAVSVPSTILWPDSDPLFPIGWSDGIDQAFDNADMISLRNTGHFASREAADEFSAAIMSRVSGRPSD